MQTRVSRRRFLKGIAATGAAAVGPFVVLREGWSQTGPIKIGILEPLSGPVAYIGEGNLAGFRFGAEHVNAAGLAIYFAKMAPEKYTTFYLLNQDYNFGRAAAEGFKKKFNKIKSPDQRIVGDEYHPLQKTQDFGPYITKIMASGAQVVMTGD